MVREALYVQSAVSADFPWGEKGPATSNQQGFSGQSNCRKDGCSQASGAALRKIIVNYTTVNKCIFVGEIEWTLHAFFTTLFSLQWPRNTKANPPMANAAAAMLLDSISAQQMV
jgi:hypothetical protein